MSTNTIGQNISHFRKQRGMTQEELAEKMAVTAQAVSKWECDTSYPDITVMRTLAKVLEVSMDELMEGERDLPAIKEATPESIDRRIILIDVQTGDTHVITRIPVAAAKKAIENGALERMVGTDVFEQMAGLLDMAEAGITGPLVEVDNPNAHVRITVEDYEG